MARILVAEDDPKIGEIIRKCLASEGHSVTNTSTGKAAVEELHRAPVDLLVTDLFMPDMDGLELIPAIRRAQPALPILAVSGGGYQGQLDMLDVARQLGASAVLKKPFNPAELRAAVQRLLDPAADPES